MNINKYLKSIGLSGDTKHKQLDNRLFLSLDDSGQDKLHAAWETMRLFGRSSDLYSVPQNLKQASLLFSHDYERIKKSIEWIENTISYLNSQSIIDMGCGYGVLIKYLQTKYPDINLMGIDKKPNLIQIGRTLTGINLICEDYSDFEPVDAFDTIVCDFGFDLEDLKLPKKPHNTSNINGIVYCPNCCKDFKSKLSPFMSGWRKWGVENANLIMTGRLTINRSYLLATLEVANELNWNLDVDRMTCLKINNKRSNTPEKFPGFLFQTKNENKVKENFVKVVNLLGM